MENNSPNIQLEMNFSTPGGNRFRRCLDNGVFVKRSPVIFLFSNCDCSCV